MADFVTDLARFLDQQQVPDLWAWLLLAPDAPSPLVEERLAERRRWAEAHVGDPIYGMEAVFVLVHEDAIRAELARTAPLVARRRRGRTRTEPAPVDTVSDKARRMHRDAELPAATPAPLGAEDEITAAVDTNVSAPSPAHRRRGGRELFRKAGLSLRTIPGAAQPVATPAPLGEADATEDQEVGAPEADAEETQIHPRVESGQLKTVQLRGLVDEEEAQGPPVERDLPNRGRVGLRVATFSRRKMGGLVSRPGAARPGALRDPERDDHAAVGGIRVTRTRREEIPEEAARVSGAEFPSDAPTTIRPASALDAPPNLAVGAAPPGPSGLRRAARPSSPLPEEDELADHTAPRIPIAVPPPRVAVRMHPADAPSDLPFARSDARSDLPPASDLPPIGAPRPPRTQEATAPPPAIPPPPERGAPIGVTAPPVSAWLLVTLGLFGLVAAGGLAYLTFHVKPPGFGGVPMDPVDEERGG